jgi:formate/nitrite transporter FocA (FNT family)
VFLYYLVPTLIGNTIGGVTLVAALNHAQVVAGGEGEDV